MFAYVFASMFLNTLPILFPTILINLHQPSIIKAFKDELEFNDESRNSEKPGAHATVVVASTISEATIEESTEDIEEEEEQEADVEEVPVASEANVPFGVIEIVSDGEGRGVCTEEAPFVPHWGELHSLFVRLSRQETDGLLSFF